MARWDMGAERFALVAALVVLLVVPGCSPVVAAYRSARDVWTESVDVYDQLESTLFIRATLKTEDFRRGYVQEYTRIFALDEGQEAQLLAQELEEHAEHLVVMVALYTERLAWDDLTARRGIWSTQLVTRDGTQVRPTGIARQDLKNPTWRHLYPYIGYHFSFWELQFPLATTDGAPVFEGGAALSLVIAGAPGRAEVTWAAP